MILLILFLQWINNYNFLFCHSLKNPAYLDKRICLSIQYYNLWKLMKWIIILDMSKSSKSSLLKIRGWIENQEAFAHK